MAEQQEPVETLADHFSWSRMAIMAAGLVAAFALVMWGVSALAKYKCRRAQQAAIPRAYLLPMYVHRQGSRQLESSSTPVQFPTASPYPAPPEMPSQAHGGEDPARHRSSITFYLQTRTRAHSDANDNSGVYVWGSVQHQTSRRGRRNHQTHRRENTHESTGDSVETLPRYDEPPSYKSDNGSQHAA